MNRNQVIAIAETHLLPIIQDRYDLENTVISVIAGHEGGRNLFYLCECQHASDKVIRIAFLPDRTPQDFLGELAFVRYLANGGASVADVIESRQGCMLEEISYGDQSFFVSVFEKAKGEQLVDRGYRYREGVPLTEYFYSIGQTLGQIHALSKQYTPDHPRYSFFDKYTPNFIQHTIPDSLPLLRDKLLHLLQRLDDLEKTPDTFGLVHFDYSDGNYMIDYDTGDLTVFDFDNACTCWYLVDLANVWVHGVGWIQFEADADKRRQFMDEFFATVIEGYRSETDISEKMLEQLPLFIDVTVMESVLDAFEVMRRNGEEPECDEELSYRIQCIENDIPYLGFFDDIYDCNEPFEYEIRAIE